MLLEYLFILVLVHVVLYPTPSMTHSTTKKANQIVNISILTLHHLLVYLSPILSSTTSAPT